MEGSQRVELDSSLGNSAKSWRGFQESGTCEGVQEGLEVGGSAGAEPALYDPRVARLERFALQSAARRLLPTSRTARCLRVPRAGHREVAILRSPANGSTAFSGLQTCGSVWACPVCAHKISEHRRRELMRAIAKWRARGGIVVMLTLTSPHHEGQALAWLMERQADALHRFWRSNLVKRCVGGLNLQGRIRSWEVTHGRKAFGNGWHSHQHCVLFHGLRVSGLNGMEDSLFPYWERACVASGLEAPVFGRGLRLDEGDEVGEYVAKGTFGADSPDGVGVLAEDADDRWTLAHEMTKGHIKRAARGKGETPRDLLRAFLAGTDELEAGQLYREYVTASKGRRQLVWSDGLRDLLALEELSDDEVAKGADPEAVVLGSIGLEDWRRILKVDARGEILEVARMGWDAVVRFLSGLPIYVVPQKNAEAKRPPRCTVRSRLIISC
jgi:hypothetical protein